MTDVKQAAGRLIFAAGDRDGAKVLEALRDVPREQNFALVLTLADTAAAALEALHGEGWRDALSFALLDAELEAGVNDGSAEMG